MNWKCKEHMVYLLHIYIRIIHLIFTYKNTGKYAIQMLVNFFYTKPLNFWLDISMKKQKINYSFLAWINLSVCTYYTQKNVIPLHY